MSPAVLPLVPAESFFNRWNHELTAIGTALLVILVIFAVDRAFRRRGRQLAERMVGGALDPVVETRLRFVRRFVELAIGIVGVAVAISQFTALDRLATSILASGAIAAAAVGFAARQVLANLVAGVMLAVNQPIRIGDQITLDEHTGVVEDIRLTYTYLRLGNDARLIVPNELLAGSVLRNDSIVTATVAVDVELMLPHDIDEARAMEAIEAGVEGAKARVKAVVPEGVTLGVEGEPASARDRPQQEAELRAKALRALREAGLREGAAERS